MDIAKVILKSKDSHGGGSGLTLPKKYPWLHSEYSELSWEISDPGGGLDDLRENINFDGPLIGGGTFSDYPSIIEDIKVSLVLAIELNGMLGGLGVNSRSRSRTFVNSQKRIINELYCLGFKEWSSWESWKNEHLFKRLSLRESASLGYLARLQEYVHERDLEELPWSRSNKTPSRIQSSLIYKELGLNRYAARNDTSILRFWQQCHLDYKNRYPEKSIEFREDLYSGKIEEDDRVNLKQFEVFIDTIILLEQQSALVPELFHLPWTVPIVSSRKGLIDKYFPDIKGRSENRTRNIPVPVFLSVLDCAARYVLDYAPLLLKLENRARTIFQQEEVRHGSYQAGKNTNAIVRGWGVLQEGKHSPFPLAAYKQFQDKSGNIPDEWWEIFERMLHEEVSSREIQDRLGITKAQFDGRKYRLVNGSIKCDQHSGVSLNKAIYQYLAVSCLLIILSLSARREVEVYGLRPGSYKMVNGEWMINFYCAKTKRKSEWFTAVPIMIRAIKILEKLSLSARKETESDDLFSFNDSFDRANVRIRQFDEALEDFQRFIGVETDESGSYHKFSEHQFRRFFAVMFFYRYPKERGLNFEILMHELRHEDWEMSTDYITEMRQGAIFREVEAERVADYALRVIEEDGVYGPMASELTSLIQDVLTVYPEQRRSVAIEAAKKKALVVEFITEGICFGLTPGREASSNCYEDGHVMIHRCSEEICEGCPSLLSVDEIKTDNSRKICTENIDCGSDIFESVLAKSS